MKLKKQNSVMERKGNVWIALVMVLTGMLTASCGTSDKAKQVLAGQTPFDGVGIVAHRGYWNCEAGGFARNSVASLKAAQEAGFWGSEFDVNMTADSVLLVFHDSSLGGKRIDQNPYSAFAEHRLENGEPIPTLEKYLEQAQQCATTTLVFEMKQHATPQIEDAAVQKSVALLKEYGLLSPDRVIFISFSLHACRELARLCPGFTVQYLGADLWPAEVLDNGLNGIDLNFGAYMGSTRYLQEARACGMSVNVWTVNNPDDMQKAISMRIDQLTTDEPMKARELLGEKEVKKQVFPKK
jgi:glycerophosphoryl diester phosphodiesterase